MTMKLKRCTEKEIEEAIQFQLQLCKAMPPKMRRLVLKKVYLAFLDVPAESEAYS